MPLDTQPAQPAHYIAEACETGNTAKLSTPLFASKSFIFVNPQSTTNLTPSIVTAVSARLVDKIIFLTPSYF